MRFVLYMTLLTSPAWGPPALALAAPPEVPSELKVKAGQLVRVTVKGDVELGTAKNFKDEEAFWGELVAPKGSRQFVFQAPADGKRAQYVVSWWSKGETEGVTTTITVEGVTPPGPPIPPDPGPGPKPGPDPPPQPVTSFHVVVIYESGTTYPPKQAGVLDSGDIRAYLDSATTPDAGTKGWRKRDKDLSADNDTPTQKALWDAVRAKLRPTDVPCWAVEVNGKVDIIPLPGSVAEGLAILRKYKGEN